MLRTPHELLGQLPRFAVDEQLGSVVRSLSLISATPGVVVSLATILWLGVPVSGLQITGGPVYELPKGGSCLVTGIPGAGSGTHYACSGVDLGAYTHVYFGIKNAACDKVHGKKSCPANPNGNSMNGSPFTAGGDAIFTIDSFDRNSITYQSKTGIVNELASPNASAVTSHLTLTVTDGAATVVPTKGTPADTGWGDIGYLFKIDSASFSVTVTIVANSPDYVGLADSAVFDPTHTPEGTQDSTSVDLAFYYYQSDPSSLGKFPDGDSGASASATALPALRSTGDGRTDSPRLDGADADRIVPRPWQVLTPRGRNSSRKGREPVTRIELGARAGRRVDVD